MEDLKQHYLDEMLSLSNDFQIKDYRNEKIDIRFRRECKDMIDELKSKFNGMSIEINKKKELQHLDQPEDSLIMGNEELSTIPEKESDEVIKSSVEDFVPIPSEFEDTSRSDSECILPLCDDFSPINIYEEKSVTFSNPLFDSNNDFTSSNDESLSDEDVSEDNFKIYSNPLFEFDDEYISSDVNALFNEVLEDIECKDSYDSNLDESTFTYPSQRFKSFCYDDDDDYDYEERSIPLRDIISKLPPSIAITPVLPTLEPEDSLIMGNEELSTIPEKDSDEVIKSSVKDFVPIPSESEDTSRSDSECILPSCDDFSPINVYEEKSVTFSNPLFDSNDDFTSSDDESLSDEDVSEDNVKIYSNPLFEFDDEYISSDVNPLFNEVTTLSFYFTMIRLSVVSILEGFIDEPPLEENDDLFDLKSKTNEWKKILYDAPVYDLMTKDKFFDPGGDIDEIDAFHDVDISTDIKDDYHDSEGDIFYLERLLSNDTILSLPPEVFFDHDQRSLSDNNDLKIMVNVFDPEIHEKIFSPTYVSLTFEDRHYLSFTYVIHIFLSYFTYPVVSPFLLSSGSEDIIFDPEIPSGEIKVHIEVLSVLWGNRLPIPDGSLPLSRCGHYLGDGFCSFCNSEAGNSFVNDSNPNSFNDPPNVFTHPPQPQYETYSCELCGNDSHHGYDCPPQFPLVYE
ncbi:hypothetical protein Tco_0474031 [Tanacetum coccineum]